MVQARANGEGSIVIGEVPARSIVYRGQLQKGQIRLSQFLHPNFFTLIRLPFSFTYP